MTSQQWLADYLEQGAQGPGPYAPDVASADAAQRLRDLLAEPDGWAEPPAGLLDEILASIDSERVAASTLTTNSSPAGRPRLDAPSDMAFLPGGDIVITASPPRPIPIGTVDNRPIKTS
jgi:hypothetical protein